MKRDNVNYVLVGSFVVLVTIAFVIFLVAVTGRSGPTDAYLVHYANVTGLKFGTGVYYEGYRIGQIERITPELTDHGMQYQIELGVSSGWKIPVDSVARIQASGLIAAVSIEIAQGQERRYLNPGDTIEGQGQTDLFAMLNQAAGDFRNLSRDGLLPLLQNLNNRVSQLSDDMLEFRRKELSPLVSMIHERVEQDLIADTASLIGHLDESALQLKKILSKENEERVATFLVHIDDVAVNLNDVVARIETTRVQMDELVAALIGLVDKNDQDLTATVSATRRSMTEFELALQTLNQHLGSILKNIEGGSRHMNEFSRAIRENPSRLIRTPSSSGSDSP